MVAELVVYVIGPTEPADGEKKRHEEVPREHSQHIVLSVSSVRDENLLVDDAESVLFGHVSDQLYVVELQAGIESPLL
jgi:hypothetical protein